MQVKQRTILITGANRGIGYGIAQSLMENNPLKLNIIITARSVEKGEEALEKLKLINPEIQIQFMQLEIGNEESYAQLISRLQKEKLKIDILVNNAGVNAKGSIKAARQEIFNINFFGNVNFTKAIFNQLTDDAKIIFLTSSWSTLNRQSTYSRSLFSNPQITEEQIFQHAKDVEQGKFSEVVNQFSYTCLMVWVRWHGIKMLKDKQNIFMICPGWVQTDMGGPNAPYTIKQGISYPIQLINEFPFQRSERNGKLYSYGHFLGY